MKKKHLIIFGANGFLGRYLTRYFLEKDWRVTTIARHEKGLAEGVEFLEWDGENQGDWVESLSGADALVNLAGRTVNCRYNDRNKKQIFESREKSTSVISEAVAALPEDERPTVWLNSSTATIYRHAEDHYQDEDNGEMGSGFSVEVAKSWEKHFFAGREDGVRRIALRTAMVLANEPGTVFDYLMKLSQFGLGGPVGGGEQRVSWLHVEDFCRAIDWLIENEEGQEIYNLSAPEALTNAGVMKVFRGLARCPLGLPATKWMAEIGAFCLRTETELILKSRWVYPKRLLDEGFSFRYPEFAKGMTQLATQE